MERRELSIFMPGLFFLSSPFNFLLFVMSTRKELEITCSVYLTSMKVVKDVLLIFKPLLLDLSWSCKPSAKCAAGLGALPCVSEMSQFRACVFAVLTVGGSSAESSFSYEFLLVTKHCFLSVLATFFAWLCQL